MRLSPGNLRSTNGVFYNVTVLTRHPKSDGAPEESGRGAVGRPAPRQGRSGKRKTGSASAPKDGAAEIARQSGATGRATISSPPPAPALASPTARPGPADLAGPAAGAGRATQPGPAARTVPTARASIPLQARARARAADRPAIQAVVSNRVAVPPGAAAGQASARRVATEPVRARASTADRARAAARTKVDPPASGTRKSAPAARGRVSVGRAGDTRVRGPVAPRRRPWRRRPPYVYRLADLDELFATAGARTDAETEQRRDRSNRRSNWRVIGVVLMVATGLAIATAGLVNEAVTFVMNIFAA